MGFLCVYASMWFKTTFRSGLNLESTPKSKSAPKSPKGDFHKVLIFSVSPL
jgi:hypothetical protein